MDNPYAPPTAEPVAPSPLNNEHLTLASRGQRFVGSLIDGLIIGIPLFVVIFVFFENSYAEEGVSGYLWEVGTSVAAFIMFTAINFHFMTEGQTIGKKVMGIQVRDYLTNLVPSAQKQITGRYLFQYAIQLIPFLGSIAGLVDACFIFGSEKRCLHDLVGGTQVVVKPKSV